MSKYPVRKIAITGRARSGKDTVGNYLVEKYEFKRFAFADSMKHYFHRLFPHIPAEPKPRHAYQVFGEGMRHLDLPGATDVWINACMNEVNAHVWWHGEVDERGANVVITDLRLPREYESLRANGFTIVRVTAAPELRSARAQAAGDAFEEKDLSHDTEQWVDQFEIDFEIVNDGSVDELKAKVDEVISAIGKR